VEIQCEYVRLNGHGEDASNTNSAGDGWQLNETSTAMLTRLIGLSQRYRPSEWETSHRMASGHRNSNDTPELSYDAVRVHSAEFDGSGA